MSYASLSFLVFVGVTMLVYFAMPVKKYQWVVLLAASWAFYLYAGSKYVFFLIFTILSTYLTALFVDKVGKHGKQTLKEHKTEWDKDTKKKFKNSLKRKKKYIMLLGVLSNLGILAFLKYYNFFSDSFNHLLQAGNAPFAMPALKLFLPLGISFYTFQSVGYVMDVYREKISAEKNVLKLSLFLSFFPQIIQGPISMYDQLAQQLYQPHSFDFTRFKYASELILWGFFKKMVIGDRAFAAISAVTDDYMAADGKTLLFVILLYALQLYADFSGGIDISRGVAQIFGVDMIENFKRPYFSTSINDYWRRWHISLGGWMKEYVFYPLALSNCFTGASKKMRSTGFGKTTFGAHVAKVLPTAFASLIVFLLVGIWHGANWKYVAFGIWNGGIIMLSTLLTPLFTKTIRTLRINTSSFLFRVFQILRTFLIVLVGYVFDVAPTFSASMMTFKRILENRNFRIDFAWLANLGLEKLDVITLIVCVIVLFVVSYIQEKHPDKPVRVMLDEKPFIVRYSVLLVGLAAVLILGVYGPGHEVAQFVYMQF